MSLLCGASVVDVTLPLQINHTHNGIISLYVTQHTATFLAAVAVVVVDA
jgi:hypothetical protein